MKSLRAIGGILLMCGATQARAVTFGSDPVLTIVCSYSISSAKAGCLGIGGATDVVSVDIPPSWDKSFHEDDTFGLDQL